MRPLLGDQPAVTLEKNPPKNLPLGKQKGYTFSAVKTSAVNGISLSHSCEWRLEEGQERIGGKGFVKPDAALLTKHVCQCQPAMQNGNRNDEHITDL